MANSTEVATQKTPMEWGLTIAYWVIAAVGAFVTFGNSLLMGLFVAAIHRLAFGIGVLYLLGLNVTLWLDRAMGGLP